MISKLLYNIGAVIVSCKKPTLCFLCYNPTFAEYFYMHIVQFRCIRIHLLKHTHPSRFLLYLFSIHSLPPCSLHPTYFFTIFSQPSWVCQEAMETATLLLAIILSSPCYIGGTDNASISPERISATSLHPWTTLDQDMSVALQSLDLCANVSLTDDTANKRNITGCESGLTTRFLNRVCNVVIKALSVSDLPNIRFGDIQCVGNNGPTSPDVTVYYFPNVDSPSQTEALPIPVGELKTWWTFFLELFVVISELIIGGQIHSGVVLLPSGQFSQSYAQRWFIQRKESRPESIHFGKLSGHSGNQGIRNRPGDQGCDE